LARHYPDLDMEEGHLYAYGFMTRAMWRLWQHDYDASDLPEFEQRILKTVRRAGPTHPSTLALEFGSHGVKNAWGGNSRAVAKALEHLLWNGLLRVSVRQKGIRMYEAAPAPAVDRPELNERFSRLLLAAASVLAPVQEKTLVQIGLRLRYVSMASAGMPRPLIRAMVKSGELEERVAEGITYLWPAGTAIFEEAPRIVRILAPFDPLVWDRKRFEHFWGWEYRFEAYVPAAKRVRGYYAMPLLWGEEVIGWVNASTAGGKFAAEVGYVEKQPREKGFARELKAEIGRLEEFLSL
jgi:hypothetical protein